MENKKISRSEIAKHSGLSWKDYLFYSLGDFAICLVFQCANALLTVYYTDCLLFNPIYVIIIFVVARVWDAINDPIMGRIADSMKPNKHGKFKRWFLYMCGPFAIASILMFIQHGGAGSAPWWQYIIACLTYILFGMSMTAIQIPYGSLAGIVTLDAKERGKLSIWRGVFASLGSLPVLIVKAYALPKGGDPETGKAVSWKPLIIGVSILAFFTIIFMIICYLGTKERVTPKEITHEKGAFKKSIHRITHNRAMLSLCVITIIVAGGDMFNGVISVFVSMNFFNQTGFFTVLPDIFTMVGIIVTMFVVPLCMKKFGKKESVAMGLIFATVIAIAQVFIIFMPRHEAQYPYYIYVVAKFLCGVGVGFFNSLLWGMVADCCDDIQIKTNIKEDGTTYSILMFSRKVGQCIAFVLGQVILIVIKYYDFKSQKQPLPESSQNGLFVLSTIILIACYATGAILTIFWYPINKDRLEEIQDAKELLLEKENNLNTQSSKELVNE